ncbi:unnamed protein product, partial [Didymodactylos carnosus]
MLHSWLRKSTIDVTKVWDVYTTIMKVLIALCVLFIGAFSAAAFNTANDDGWNLFKQVHSKQYTNEQEVHRRSVWESNLQKIRTHNLEADLGVHTYTMKMNKYGDL